MFFERVCILVDLERHHERLLRAGAHVGLGAPLFVDLVGFVPGAVGGGPECTEVDGQIRDLVEGRLRESETSLRKLAEVELSTRLVVTTTGELRALVMGAGYDLVIAGPTHASALAGLACSVLEVRGESAAGR